jgi:hydrogenase maturation protein HypF
LGRLFDAAAALLSLGSKNRFEAELPMALEAIVENGIEDAYPIELHENNGVWNLEHAPIIEGIIQDIHNKISKTIIAARFHNSVCDGLLELAKKARRAKNLSDVALSGGVFCNRYLANRLIRRLQDEGFRVLWKKSIPANDGGISLGQAAIAAALIKQKSIGK